MTTVQDSKLALEQALPSILRRVFPQTSGYSVEADILEKSRRKRSDASSESWRPATGEIRIRFGPPASVTEREDDLPLVVPPEGLGASPAPPSYQESRAVSVRIELVRALEKAERRPGFDFVSLKWFRDLFLPAQGYWWSEDPAECNQAIRSGVEDGLLLTYKVPNPKTPAFPVTALRLNRQHPEVVEALQGEPADSQGFAPVDLRGEPLSATVLRERR